MIKDQQRHPVRGQVIHLDLLEVKLDEAIEADVTIELLGTEEAPGVKEGGVLEHVTHQITISALPTEIPESIAADVSGMEIGDTLQLAMVPPPEGVEYALGEDVDPEEITIATLSPPRVEEEPEELEEEAELIGEDGEPIEPAEGEEAAEGEEPATRPRRSRAHRRRLRRRGVALRLFGRHREDDAGDSDRRPVPDRRPGQPGSEVRRDAPQPRLRGRGRALAPLGPAEGEGEVPGLIAEGRTAPGGPAGRASCCRRPT